jgi:hypothetical protein
MLVRNKKYLRTQNSIDEQVELQRGIEKKNMDIKTAIMVTN